MARNDFLLFGFCGRRGEGADNGEGIGGGAYYVADVEARDCRDRTRILVAILGGDSWGSGDANAVFRAAGLVVSALLCIAALL